MSAVENPPAFPRPRSSLSSDQAGMTLRDWFAGQALNALWPVQGGVIPGGDLAEQAETASVWAYTIADAMLATRQNGGAA